MVKVAALVAQISERDWAALIRAATTAQLRETLAEVQAASREQIQASAARDDLLAQALEVEEQIKQHTHDGGYRE